MKFKGIIFDINGTLVDIWTDEGNEQIYRSISQFLKFQGIRMHRQDVRDEYYRLMSAQKKASGEEFPEFDAVGLWRSLLETRMPETCPIAKQKLRLLPQILAEMYRAISLNRLQLFPQVQEIVKELAGEYALAVVSDAQSAWALPEMRTLGIAGYFNPIVVSGDYGYRKPDERLFRMALAGLKLEPSEVLFVGNDVYRDIYGAKRLGMKTVFFSSNSGQKSMDGVEPDYIIYAFSEFRRALAFLEGR